LGGFFRTFDDLAEPKVGKLNVALLIQQDVFGFEAALAVNNYSL